MWPLQFYVIMKPPVAMKGTQINEGQIMICIVAYATGMYL